MNADKSKSGYRLGLSCKGHRVRFAGGVLVDRDHVIASFDARYGSHVGDACARCVGGFAQEFLCDLAIRLELAEFGGAFVEQAMSLSASAVDRFLNFFGFGVGGFHGIEDEPRAIVKADDEVRFDFAAAAETPHGSADFVDKIAFEDADRGEIAEEFGVEFIVGGLVGWPDEIAVGIESVGEAVFGRGGFARFGARAGGGLSVRDVGCDLSWCRHVR